MKKLIISLVIILTVVVGVFGFVHNSITDRFNPLLKETTSYATVSGKLSAGSYTNVKAKNSDGTTTILKQVGSYDSGKYIAIIHKGQYVKTIAYLTPKEYQAAVK